MKPSDFQSSLFYEDEGDKKLLETLYIIMKEFGYTLEEMKVMPIPTFMLIIKMMNEEQRNQKRTIGKIKK